MKTTFTQCGICEQACGLKVSSENNKVLKVEPDKDNHFSWRDYCIKAGKSYLALDNPKRITKPMKRVGDGYVESTYEEAIADISARFGQIIDKHGANALASYTGNPNSFNFGSALFHTMFLDAVGTQNRYWVGSIDQNPMHVVSEEVYGNAWVSLMPDVDHSDYFLFIGMNPQISGMNWIGFVPNGWKRILARKKAGAKLVVVDPRRTECASKASQHIAPLPESDWALLLAMIKVIFENGWQKTKEHPALANVASGLAEIEKITGATSIESLSERCDISQETIVQLAKEFSQADKAMAIARTGVAQGRNGALALWLVKVLNYITGRVESEGGLYYSISVLNMLAAGESLYPKSDAVSRLKGNKNIAGAHSLAELPDEITTKGEGQIRALIMNSGNPVVSGPNGDKLDAALEQLDCFVAIDLFQRESHRHAHWLIPGDHFLERNEVNPLLSALSPAPHVQMTRAAVDLPEGTQYEWEFLRDLTLAMNKPLLMGKPWLNPLVKASIAFSKVSGNKHHALSPLFLAKMLIKSGGMFKWKDIKKAEHGLGEPEVRPKFGTLFDTLEAQNTKVNIAPDSLLTQLSSCLQAPLRDPDLTDYPLQLISRRRMNMMNSWSGETSMQGMSEKDISGDIIEMNLADGERFSLEDGQWVMVNSKTSQVKARVKLSDNVRPSVAVMEHGWGTRTFDPKTGEGRSVGGVNRNVLVSGDDVDPLSRVPRLNGTPIAVSALIESSAA